MRRVVAPLYPAPAYTWAAAPSNRSRISIRPEAYPRQTIRASNHLHTLWAVHPNPLSHRRLALPSTDKKKPGFRRARVLSTSLSTIALRAHGRGPLPGLRLDRILEIVEESPRPSDQWDREEKPPCHRTVERHPREIHRVRQLRLVVRDEQEYEERRGKQPTDHEQHAVTATVDHDCLDPKLTRFHPVRDGEPVVKITARPPRLPVPLLPRSRRVRWSHSRLRWDAYIVSSTAARSETNTGI